MAAFLRAALVAAIAAAVSVPAGAAPRPAGPTTVCDVQTTKSARPTEVTLGEEVEITLRVDGHCPPAAQPGRADIVLAIDRSASQADNGTWDDTVRAATAFVERVDYARHKVGILTFSGQFLGLGPVTVLHQSLTSDGAAVRAALAAVPNPPFLSGTTNLTAAVEAAQTELTTDRHRPEALPVLVLLSDGGHNANTAVDPVDAARAAKDAGTLVITIGLAVDQTAADALRTMASRASLYFPSPSGAELEGILGELAGSVGGTGRVTGLEVVDYLGPQMAYVPGSAVPPPTEVQATILRWTVGDLPEDGWTARYRVRPLIVGTLATNKLAYADYIDADGSVGTRDFPIPTVVVRAAVPTPTSLPGATPSPVVEPTPSPAPTRRAWPSEVYLPIAYRAYCKPLRPFDVALVLDTSSSMWGVKLDHTRGAARQFLTFLEMPPSRAAVIAFNEAPTVVQPLTTDRAAAREALNRLPQAEGSRIDLALIEATRVLTGGAAPLHTRVIVLITDGQQVGGSVQAALDAAAAARLAGVAVYTIGFGPDVDPAFLERIAGAPERFYNAPTSDDLPRVYQAIAGAMPCQLGR